MDFGGYFLVIFIYFYNQSIGDYNIENEIREMKISYSNRIRRIPQGFGIRYRYTILS